MNAILVTPNPDNSFFFSGPNGDLFTHVSEAESNDFSPMPELYNLYMTEPEIKIIFEQIAHAVLVSVSRLLKRRCFPRSHFNTFISSCIPKASFTGILKWKMSSCATEKN